MPNFKLIQDASISDAKASAHVAGKDFDDFDIREVLDEVAGSGYDLRHIQTNRTRVQLPRGVRA